MRCSSNCISCCTFSCRRAAESCVSGNARPRVAAAAGCSAAPATPPHRFRRLLGRSSASLRRATLAETAAAAAEAAATATLTDGAVAADVATVDGAVAVDAATTAARPVCCLPTSTPGGVSERVCVDQACGMGSQTNTWLTEGLPRKRCFARSRAGLLGLLLEAMPSERQERAVAFPHEASV